MPNSDGLYSVDGDSEHDYADELSPSDGYFASGSSSNAIPNVPNVIVPDPTVRESETKAAEAKAREAAKESSFLDPRHTRGDLQPQALSARDISSYAQSAAPSTLSDSTRPLSTPPTSYAPSSNTASTRQPLRIHQAAGRTPSLYSEAPPAYTPSQPSQATPASPASPIAPLSPLLPTSQPNQTVNYGSISPSMGVESERLLGRDPESMGTPGDEEEAYRPRWSRRIRRKLPPWLNWKLSLLGIVLLMITIGFLSSGYKAVKGDNGKTIKPSQPHNGTTPTEPAQPVEPSEPAQPGPPTSEPLQGTYCQNLQYRFPDQIMGLEFGRNKNISFYQDIAGHGGNATVRIGGQVNIRKLEKGGFPSMVLEIVTNDELLRLDSYINTDEQSMKIVVPKKFISHNREEPPCVELRATIWVPEDAELQQLSVRATHLDILTLDDLSIHVGDYTKLITIVGGIASGAAAPMTYDVPELPMDGAPDFTFVPAKNSYTLDSRVVEVSSTTGDITGNWPLYDFLGLHATSGNIKTSITPKSVLESDPKPAVLSISSVSGTIHANEPIHGKDAFPIRDYLVDIKSTSGGIHTALAFGGGIELKSTASDIVADLLPILDSDTLSPANPAQLETVTTSGTTAIRILEPIWYSTQGSKAVPDFNCLQAMHKSTSANIGLRYPQSWVGDLEAETTSGKLTVKGKDVRITKASGGWPGSKLVAYKGKSGGGSTVQIRTMLGSLDAIIGDE